MIKNLFLFIILGISFQSLEAQCSRPNTDFSNCKYKAIGHRGYRHLYPENTLLSLEEAFKRGVKICEVDVCVTKDSQYVIFHDGHYGVDRTTDGTGRFYDKTYNELKLLDAGSFKGYYFKGQHIPTVEEALVLAQKYNARLYLDVKDFAPDLMKKAIKNTGVSEDRFYTAIENDLPSAVAFHKLLPKTPWVFYNGGDYPDSGLADPQFYKDLAKNGCAAIEVTYFLGGDSSWNTFEKLAHAAGLEIWTFTANMNDQMYSMKKYKMDAGEADRSWNMAQILCDSIFPLYPDSMTTGNWRFNKTLKGLGLGAAVSSYNYVNPSPKTLPVFNTCSGFGIDMLDGQDANVMLMPKQDSLDAMLVYTDFSVQDDGGIQDNFTIIMDFLVPDSSQGNYISLLSTSMPPDLNDGDVFINPNGGIGIQGDYDGDVNDGDWHRLVLSFNLKTAHFYKYLDGKYIGKNDMFGTRWSVYNSTPNGQKHGFFLLSDDDNETAPVYVSALQVRDYPMDSLEAVRMGKPKADGIPMGNADLYNLKIAGDIADSTLMDYDNQTYFLTVSSTTDLKKALLSFDPSFGATTSIASSSVIDLSSGSAQIKVTSQDKSRSKKWTICVVKQTLPVVRDTIRDTVYDTVYTGIRHGNNEAVYMIYPNPAKENLTIKSSTTDVIPFIIYDIYGREILNGKTEGELTHVNLSTLPQGIYLISVKGGNMRRFVKL